MLTLRAGHLLLAAVTSAVLGSAACAAPTDERAHEPDGESESQEAALNESKSLGMTDVTILYPLPKTSDFLDDMLGPTSEGDQGELLTPEIFGHIASVPSPKMIGRDGQPMDPPSSTLFANWEDSFSHLRVVGIRLDPCFGQSANLGAASCKNTIRLTAQFFHPRAQVGNRAAVDGASAIHLFYEVSRQDFTVLAKAMLALRKTTGLPLQKQLITTQSGVHPTMAEEGVRGPYAIALKDLILKYAGERTLTQIAFCLQDRGAPAAGYYNNNGVADSRWVFGRFGYENGTVRALDIETLGYTGLQTVDSATPIGAGRDTVVVTPPATVPDKFLQTFNRKPEANGQLDPAKMEAARRSSLNLQNPKKYAASSSDCVSCHMAKQAAPNHAADPLDFKSFTYRLDHTNDLVGPFRLFGYDGAGQPVVSARVVNESAVVLDYLNRVVMR